MIPLIPANAGTQIIRLDRSVLNSVEPGRESPRSTTWVPAFAGMSGEGQ